MLIRLGVTALLVWLVAGGPVRADDLLQAIRQRGQIVVGVKADYPPWGFVDQEGRLAGLEIDLAQDLAHRLAVDLVTVPVTTANRVEFLRQGKIDLILATMSDSPARRQAVGVIDPPYYAGGTAVLSYRSLKLKTWQELAGKRVCGILGAYYNRVIAEQFGATLVTFAALPEAENALKLGSCVALVQDSSLISNMVGPAQALWADFEMPLPPLDERPWVMAVRSEERDRPYGRQLSGIVEDWHRTGKILDLERQWQLPPTQFAQVEHDKYR